MTQKACPQCSSLFTITPEDLKFYDKFSPAFNGQKKLIPSPSLCPDCRHLKRILWRNERCLYKRSCDQCQKNIISIYQSPTSFPVYCSDCWWGDDWSPQEYGCDYDFSRPFFDQFQDLLNKVPHLALVSSPDARENNCDYINFAGHSKNCYMVFDSDFNEDSYYSNVLKHSKNCLDCSYVRKSERCYECVDCTDCYDLKYSQNCFNCSESYFLKNCTGCKNCLYCVNLQHKEFCIKNKQYSKEEYFRKIEQFQLGQRSFVQKARGIFQKFALKFPHKFQQSLQIENSTGNYLFRTKNTYQSFSIEDSEDIRYSDSLYESKNCMDVSAFGEKIDHVYESGTIGINCHNIKFCFACVINCSDLLYSVDCRMTRNSFGCASMKRGEYCVLNKKYSKEEYEKLVSKIIEQMKSSQDWGKFFPDTLSPFTYNETIAQEYFPITKDEAVERGWKWKEINSKSQAPNSNIQIADDIKDVSSDIIKVILHCDTCGENYKVISQELKFYQQLGIPLPSKCPDCRHSRRMDLRNNRQLFERQCGKCSKNIQTTYALESKEIVYCEECYLGEVY